MDHPSTLTKVADPTSAFRDKYPTAQTEDTKHKSKLVMLTSNSSK